MNANEGGTLGNISQIEDAMLLAVNGISEGTYAKITEFRG